MWWANTQSWHYTINDNNRVYIALSKIEEADYADAKPWNQLNLEGETYYYVAFLE